jgi:predicted molibdopterin-dependent oxidoreductase YjgC
MCDIGRFDYHWIESGARLRRPLMRDRDGVQQPVAWHELLGHLAGRLGEAGRTNPDGVRFLLSAHAAHEEMFLFRRLARELVGDAPDARTIGVSWRVTQKSQPEHTTFRVPAEDAPNVAGARLFGLAGPGPQPDVAELSAAARDGRLGALFVFDSGPDGSLGDVTWILEARAAGKLPLLIVQGVVLSDLALAADFVLPGASSVEKDASYTNDQGHLQGAARAIAPPGEALEDWQIVVRVANALGVPFQYATSAAVRADIAASHSDVAGFQNIDALTFSRPVAARTWLQASNPSERWKWDFMFQDLPPVKGAVDPSALPLPPGSIPLKEIKA